MTRIFKSKIFVRYLLISASFLLLCCIVLCSLLMISTQREYRAAQTDIAVSRMSAALEDLDAQINLLCDVANSVSTGYRFRKSYWQQGEYYQMDMVQQLSNYRNWSPFADEFALIYNESDYVFLSSGYKTYLDIFARSYYQQEPEWFLSRMQASYQQLLIEHFDDDHLMFFLPARTSGYNQSSGWATLLVICDTQQITQRIRSISGLKDRFSLTYNGTPLLGEEIDESNAILCRSGSFVLRCDRTAIHSNGLIPHLSPLVIVLLALFTLAMILLFGYVNYRPIYGLASKYVENASDELTAIDDMLASLIHSGDENRRHLRDIYSHTRKTLVRAVLHGDVGADSEDLFHVLDSVFEAQSYAAFALGPIQPENDYDNLTDMIEDLSDSAITFHALVSAEDGCVAVVAALSEYELYQDAHALLRSLLAEYSARMDVSTGSVCKGPEEIPQSYREACSRMNAMSLPVSGRQEADELFDRVFSGHVLQAQDAMERWMRQVIGSGGKQANEKSAAHDLVVSLLENADRRCMKLTEPEISALVRVQNPEEFAARLFSLIDAWCAERPASDHDHAPSRAQSICDFIRDHYSNPDLSLDMIADEFSVSVNTVCRMVKQQLGKTFREYLISLRLEEARKQLLLPDANVSKVCAAVGYTNLSYFIRSFKDYCGVTPSEYRRATEE